MKGWLEAAKECGCASPDECSLFPDPGEAGAAPPAALKLVHVADGDCRR
jgi:hypothetical protein